MTEYTCTTPFPSLHLMYSNSVSVWIISRLVRGEIPCAVYPSRDLLQMPSACPVSYTTVYTTTLWKCLSFIHSLGLCMQKCVFEGRLGMYRQLVVHSLDILKVGEEVHVSEAVNGQDWQVVPSLTKVVKRVCKEYAICCYCVDGTCRHIVHTSHSTRQCTLHTNVHLMQSTYILLT